MAGAEAWRLRHSRLSLRGGWIYQSGICKSATGCMLRCKPAPETRSATACSRGFECLARRSTDWSPKKIADDI